MKYQQIQQKINKKQTEEEEEQQTKEYKKKWWQDEYSYKRMKKIDEEHQKRMQEIDEEHQKRMQEMKNREKSKFKVADYIFDENEKIQFQTDLQKCSDHFIDLQEQLKIKDKSIKKEELNKEIEITTQKIKDIRKTIRRADKVIKIQTERPNLTTGQFFIWSIFLTITRSIVVICGVFILILLFTGIHQLFAKKVKRKGSAGW